MQTATYLPPSTLAPTQQQQQHSVDPLRASVGHLLTRAYNLPCSTASHAFSQLVQPTSRFQLALDALLPLLLDQPAELAQRILVSYILYSLYAPHPISINPFKSVLFVTFIKERDQAVKSASGGSIGENEQLVWVLWKILRGDGNDIGPYSPSTLARSPLPPKLRASNLTLEEETYHFSGSPSPKERDLRSNPDLNSGLAVNSQQRETSDRVTEDEEARNENIAQAMDLLLAARERVLTLSEQRFIGPLIPQLTSPPMITSFDLGPIISHNPNLAHPLFIALLTAPNCTCISTYLDVLKRLPPTLSSFDLMGRLLHESTVIADFTTGGRTTVADLVRTEVLGRFIFESINWLDVAEREEREGLISDDRFPKGVQNLCRFYNSLIKLSVVDPALDTDSTEMAHFTLRNARFEEANALYRVLAMGKF